MSQIRKAIIVSAPSGAGKTTIVTRLIASVPGLGFSVSACSRAAREGEVHEKDYYFLDLEDFINRIDRDEFVEWQEVYPGSYYGTLKSELERLWETGKIPVFDVDVLGGLNLKRYFGEDALAIFIEPPSKEVLIRRLQNRGTESPESLENRIRKADYELTFTGSFDRVVVNDDLETAYRSVAEMIAAFIGDGH